MKIYNVVFISNSFSIEDEIRYDEYSSQLDCNTIEISSPDIRQFEEDLRASLNLTNKDKEKLITLIGEEVYNALLKEEIDMVILN